MSGIEKVIEWRPSAAQKLSSDLSELGKAAIAGGMTIDRFEEIRTSIWFRVRLPGDSTGQRRHKKAEERNRKKKKIVNEELKKIASNASQRWTDADSEMVMNASMKDADIARLTGRSLLAIASHRVWLKRGKNKARPRLALGKVPEKVMFEGRELTRRQIMIELGISPTTVKRRIREQIEKGVKDFNRSMFSKCRLTHP